MDRLGEGGGKKKKVDFIEGEFAKGHDFLVGSIIGAKVQLAPCQRGITTSQW